ncbi:MDR family MFS transporter [Vallitalea guaymasensis]|uniref:MDR family MFS transporter n=1 Tax=Vallitalea guaymasensis TaxID=1185412 RepID=UPI00272C652E|nr:MFS transporter [Vallitalea guaymasensis]
MVIKSFKQYSGLPKEIYILAIQRFVNSLGGFVYAFLTLFLSKRLGLQENVIGTFMLICSLVGIPGSLISGHLVDKCNRKTILLVSRTLSAFIFIICGFLGNSITVVYLLIISSFISSFSGPASGAMTADLTTPENRKQSFSLLYLGMNVGLAFGFTIAGYLFENYTKWIFWGDGITSLLSLLLVVFYIKDTRPTKAQIKEINESDREGEKEEKGSVVTALVRRPFLLGFVIISSVIGFVYNQHGFIMPLHLEELFPDMGAKYFGNVMAINTIIVVVFTPIIMYCTRRIKPVVNVAIATLTYIVGFGMMGLINELWVFFVAVFIWTTGEIIATTNTGVYISNHSPVNHRGRFNSIIGMIQAAGRSFAPFFMGMFLVSHSNSQGWILTGFVAIIAFIMLYILFTTEKRHNENIDNVQELLSEKEAS